MTGTKQGGTISIMMRTLTAEHSIISRYSLHSKVTINLWTSRLQCYHFQHEKGEKKILHDEIRKDLSSG